MGKVIEFKKAEKRVRTYTVTVCDGTQNYQVFKAEEVKGPTGEHHPTLEPAYDAQVLWRGDTITIDGPDVWAPLLIKGQKEIGEAISEGEPPIRVTFEAHPHEGAWWEMHDVFLSAKSKGNEHILLFKTATKHKHG
jgi:hypothetical protein